MVCYGAGSVGVPGSLSLLKRPLTRGGGMTSRRPGGLRAPSPRQPCAVFGSERGGRPPRGSPETSANPGRCSGDDITSTRPPDLPAQTAVALACCYLPPFPSCRPAAPSPSRRSKTPPCSSRARSLRVRSCALVRRGGLGRRKEASPRRGREARSQRRLGAWRILRTPAPSAGPERASALQP